MISLIQNSIANLRAHKLKVGLTIFWIAIGITAVMIIGSVGNGVKNQMINSTQEISANKTYIRFTPNEESSLEFSDFIAPITQSDILNIESIKGVKKVRPDNVESGYSSGEMKIGEKTAYLDVYGFDENGNDEYNDNYQVIYGRKINETDRNKNVIILNQNSLSELEINPQELIGKGIEFNGNMYEVVGIMEAPENLSSGGVFEWNPLSYYSLIPKTTLDSLSLFNQNSSVSHTGIDVEFIKGYNTQELEDLIIKLLTESHPDIEGSYVREDLYDTSEELDKILSTVNSFVLISIIISMLIGGLGVMNIMYVSVIERKREIGVRRAIGATPFKIIAQFLAESTFITFIGGIFGLIIGSITLNIVSSYIPFNVELSLSVYMMAVVSCIITGIMSGIVPAIKASKINPIEAIQG